MGISLDPQTAVTAVGVTLLVIGALTAGPSTFAAVGQWLQEDSDVDVITETSQPDSYVDSIIAVCDGTPPEIVLGYLAAGANPHEAMLMELKRLRAIA